MPSALDAARAFVDAHARPLDRHRFALTVSDSADAAPLLDALDGYAVPGGGYGHGLEPDLRAPEAQPAAAMHAFEALEDIAPAAEARAGALCDWLARVMLPDGGLPFALPVSDPAGCAPFWVQADPWRSSLQITAAVAGAAHRVAARDAAVAAHPWLALATAHCLDRLESATAALHALELMFALRLLDAVEPSFARVDALRERLTGMIPASGSVHVAGGAEDEFMRPLDFAPSPRDEVRRFLPAEAVEADLDRLAAGQAEDGGWTADWVSYSPAAAREWRGYLTVRAVGILRDNGRL